MGNKQINYECVGHQLTETPRHSLNAFMGEISKTAR